jgi:hypothetical protein
MIHIIECLSVSEKGKPALSTIGWGAHMIGEEKDNSSIRPLAGLGSYTEASGPGYSVDRTVTLLRRYLYVEGETMRCLAAHLNGIPEWEAKCAISLHLWQDAEHGTWLRDRVKELRTPPLCLDEVPDKALATFFEELICSETTAELLIGVYKVLKRELIRALRRHMAEANPLADQPTMRILRFILLEEEEQLEWGLDALASLLEHKKASAEERGSLDAWNEHLRAYLNAAGGIQGDSERVSEEDLPPRRAVGPFEPVRTPRRDGRFARVWRSRGVRPEDISPHERDWWNLYVRLTEMHVPELLALVIYEWKDQPWEFYHDVARHLWDEARHAMLGEVAFEARGANMFEVPHEISFAELPNKQFDPMERYMLLWGAEQGAMKGNTGKRHQHEIATVATDPLSITFHDFDWADEVLHVHIARKWLKPLFDSREEMSQKATALWQIYERIMKEDCKLPERDVWWDEFYEKARNLA